MERLVVIFLAGISIGILFHRFLMTLILERSPDTLCSYCEWLGRKRGCHKCIGNEIVEMEKVHRRLEKERK